MLKMFLHDDEKDFFLPFLTKNKNVLEWGSGGSTIEIANRVQNIHSIEHNKEWYDKVRKELPPQNNSYFLIEPLSPYSWEKNKDGDLTQFLPYVMKPLELNITYDLIFIDGRARPYCAEIAFFLAHKNTDIFVHDYQPLTYPGRERYKKIAEIFNFVEQVHDLARFKLK